MIHSDKPESTRSSGKQIEIQIGDEAFVADLLDKKAPKTCKAFLSILPHEGITYHQFWSGSGLQVHDPTLKKMAEDHGLWPTANFPDYSENPSIYGCPGDIGFYPPPEGVEPTYIFAEIKEDLQRLNDLGRQIGRHGQQKIVLREK